MKMSKASGKATTEEEYPTSLPRDAVMRETARRIQRRMVDKGWNQSELARQAAKFMPNRKFGRDTVSTYLRGSFLPTPLRLAALAQALDCEPADLVPAAARGPAARGGGGTSVTPIDVRDIGNNMVWMRVNQSVNWKIAMQILKLLKEER